ATGLALCHEKGIVHRDVKPNNIVIGYDERPVLVDFGLAKRMDPGAEKSVQQLTETGQMLGTPGFMPPEQLEVKGDYGRIGPPSDVWSLGATLYYCLCGQQPFGKLPFNAWCFAMTGSTPTPAHELDKSVPRWLSDLCQECLGRNPGDRPTMKALAKRLDKLHAQRQFNWRRSIPLLVLVGLAIALLAFLDVMDRAAPLLELEKSKFISTEAGALIVAGKVVDRNPYWVEIQKKRYPVDELGHFELPLTGLSEGEHTLSVRASDRSGNLSQLQSIVVLVDRAAPTLTFQSKDVRDGVLKLDGLLSEDNCRLKINGQEVEVIARQFRFDIRVSGLTEDITVDIIDQVGHRTVSQAENIFVIRHSGTRMKSLRQALDTAPIGATLLLFPGVHHCPPRLSRNVEIVGLGAPETVILQLDRGLIISEGLSVSLKSLTVKSDKHGMKTVIEVREAALSIANSIVSCEGERMILASSGSQGRARAVLRMTNTKFKRRFGACLVLENSKLIAEDCQFSDLGPSLRVPKVFGSASVELRTNSEGHFRRCVVNSSRDRGVFIQQSSGFFDDCEFKANYCEGVCAIDRAKLVFKGCRFLGNNYSGVSLGNRCVGSFRNCQLDVNGQTSGTGRRRCGLAIHDESGVDVRNSQFVGNLGAGILVVKSSVNVYRCKMIKNGKGAIVNRGGAVTRQKAERVFKSLRD
ncbi:MAG: protein kinase, partial [Planctomycetota bacterium]|nr:protein kinase [Planctomycetota bacterium]